MKTKYYCGSTDCSKWTVFGWSLEHKPTAENECGYEHILGPFLTYDEAINNCPYPNDINWNLVEMRREKIQKEKEESIIYFN